MEVTGVWSHLACSDEPDHPSVKAQIARIRGGGRVRCRLPVSQPKHLHLANSGAVLALPDTWFTMVRPGIALYGVSPFADGSSPVPLRPAMRLQAGLALVKRVRAGQGVSYGHTYIDRPRPTTLALVPLGYGDGVPRHASNRGPVLVNGETFTVAGRVCMDQFVVDIGDHVARAGRPVVLFGDPERGEPISARLGGRRGDDRLRDRHPDRRAGSAALRRVQLA